MNREEAKVEASALKQLMAYDWPGNVRELENIIERALVIGQGKEISADDLPFSRGKAGLETFPKSLKKMEKMHIERVLETAGWNISQAARDLDIDRQTLYNKLEKYEIRKGDS